MIIFPVVIRKLYFYVQIGKGFFLGILALRHAGL